MKIPSWIKNFYFRYFFKVKKGRCLFIPHPGFCKNDKASIINYKADNCLIFVRYMLDNGLYRQLQNAHKNSKHFVENIIRKLI